MKNMGNYIVLVKRVWNLRMVIAFLFIIFNMNLQAQSYTQSYIDLLKNNVITDTTYTNRVHAQAYKVWPGKKIVFTYTLFKGRNYLIKTKQSNPDDDIKFRILMNMQSQLESIWDNTTSQQDSVIMKVNKMQRLVFEFSYDTKVEDGNLNKPTYVGLFINSCTYNKPSANSDCIEL